MRFLADTNVLAELVRRRPDAGVIKWASSVHELAVSVITVEEIAYGLAWKPIPRVESWFRDFLAESCTILPITAEIALHAGSLRGEFARAGRRRSQADLLIAATAAIHGLTLVTRNVRDVEGSGIAVLNPFRGAP